jgi:extracellular factor (EF) 3-hydroxypalmitic acid methyl ester biosynthesis protein
MKVRETIMDVSDSTPAIREFFLAQEAAASELRRRVASFAALEMAPLREEHRYHRVLALVHQICDAILACEEAALTRDEIVAIMEPVRRIHARSPFVARLQQWPRGYPGDFETVEYLCSGENRAAAGTLEHSCEAYALSRAIAQQHRNKVQHQAARIMRTLISNPRQTRIASLACGSCPDLRSIADHLPSLAGEIWLNDGDPGALEFSAAALRPVRDRCRFRPGDVLSVARSMPRGAFDLVLAGGLFDYLDARKASLLMKIAYGLLAPGGTFFLTNIAEGNPYRPLIEYFGNWTLIERSEEDVLACCDAAGIARSNVLIRREETGLALLIEAAKLQ